MKTNFWDALIAVVIGAVMVAFFGFASSCEGQQQKALYAYKTACCKPGGCQ